MLIPFICPVFSERWGLSLSHRFPAFCCRVTRNPHYPPQENGVSQTMGRSWDPGNQQQPHGPEGKQATSQQGGKGPKQQHLGKWESVWDSHEGHFTGLKTTFSTRKHTAPCCAQSHCSCPVLQGRRTISPPTSAVLILLPLAWKPLSVRKHSNDRGSNCTGIGQEWQLPTGTWQRQWQSPPRKVGRPRDNFGRSEAMEEANL